MNTITFLFVMLASELPTFFEVQMDTSKLSPINGLKSQICPKK